MEDRWHTYTILPLDFLSLVGYVTVHTNVRYFSCATVPGRAWLLLIWNISAYIHAKNLIGEG